MLKNSRRINDRIQREKLVDISLENDKRITARYELKLSYIA